MVCVLLQTMRYRTWAHYNKESFLLALVWTVNNSKEFALPVVAIFFLRGALSDTISYPQTPPTWANTELFHWPSPAIQSLNHRSCGPAVVAVM
jgi:hypothetical protein